MPCSEKRARLLLQRGRAVVCRLHPFTIRLLDRTVEESALQPCRVKFDPGFRRTGVALVREGVVANATVHHPLHLAEIVHRQEEVRERVRTRAAFRRRRRAANLRHRAPRFDNRRRPEGWLPPSLRSRVDHIASWGRRYSQLAPVAAVDVELVKFDTQRLQNPELSGVEYQRGELWEYEVREYLLEKWGRRCAYCGAENVPLETEHVVPVSRGGTDRVSNLTLACRPCNQAKGNRTAEEFGHPEVQERAQQPLVGAAAMNATRYAMLSALRSSGLPVHPHTAALTKWNRSRLGLPKSHTVDALCVGEVAALPGWDMPALGIRAIGRGRRCRTNVDAHGFPRGYLPRTKRVFGFCTGDLVVAEVPGGRYAGRHVGMVAVRSNGRFDIKDLHGRRVAQGICWRHCRLLQRSRGYSYGNEDAAPSSPRLKPGASGAAIGRW